MKHAFREILMTLLLAVIIFACFRVTLETFAIFLSSMEPSFYEGQRLLVNKVVYFFDEPERGDVIIFDAPGSRKGDYIKRVIALPGDTVEIKEGAVYINGTKLDEPYIKNPPGYTLAEQTIPEYMYFVLGDNRNNSDDSHNGYLVPRQNIIGKGWVSTWPPSEWGLVPDYSLEEQLDISASQ